MPEQYLVNRGHNTSTPVPIVCFIQTSISTSRIWQGQNILTFSLPRFIIQVLLIVFLTRSVDFILRPLHQPRYLANIIGGILIGPTGIGRITWVATKLFPLSSVTVLENMSYLGLIYFTFITGVEIELAAVRRTSYSAVYALTCIAIPFAIGALSAAVIQPTLNDDSAANLPSFIVFLGVALSITSFSDLAGSLADLKLLNSNVGATTLSAAILVDSCAWAFLPLAITLAQKDGDPIATLWTMMSGLGFYGAAHVIVRPAAYWAASRTPEGGAVDDFGASAMLIGVMVAALIADAVGIHAVIGAFVYGLVIPNDSPVGEALIERLEDFVDGILLPLFFAVSGIKTNLAGIEDVAAAAFLIFTVVASAVAKIAACLVVAVRYRKPLRDGMAIGLLMNMKGIIELVLLNIGRDQQMLGEESFSVLVCTSALITALVSPLLRLMFRSSRRQPSFLRRSVQSGPPESELRAVICLHYTRHVPGLLALLSATNPSKPHPISVAALHLIELSSRLSSLLAIQHQGAAASNNPTASATAGSTSVTNAIAHAFESYADHTDGVTVRLLTAVSPYPTMHHDIFAVAEDFRAALIIIPFHKHRAIDGGMDPTNPSLRSLNQSVLASAPCSVAIFVDRGLPAPSRLGGSLAAALFFLGGPDDREALAFASRIARNPQFTLTILRLLHSTGSDESLVDDEYITEFRLRHVSDDSVIYDEVAAATAEDTVGALRLLIEEGHDLYIVGKGGGDRTMLTAGLGHWSECPELGSIGDLLASQDLGVKASVLVVQKCEAMGDLAESLAPGKTTMASSRGRFSMVSAEKANYRMAGDLTCRRV